MTISLINIVIILNANNLIVEDSLKELNSPKEP